MQSQPKADQKPSTVKMKRQLIDQEKISANSSTGQGPICTNGSYNSMTKTKTKGKKKRPNQKMCARPKQTFLLRRHTDGQQSHEKMLNIANYQRNINQRRFKREGTYVYLWLIHAAVWQKPTQYCNAIILQLKINLKTIKYHLTPVRTAIIKKSTNNKCWRG